MKESYSVDYGKIKKKSFEIFKNKRYQWILIAVIFTLIIFLSSSIRLSNLSLLTDSTTGNYIPGDPDAAYFLRVVETLQENNDVLPDYDAMRSPLMFIPWHPEIMPEVISHTYKIFKIFSPNIGIDYVFVTAPVVFYVIGLVLFFLMSYYLSNKNKWIALLSSFFLAFVPAYLFRTTAGVTDHDVFGMIFVFLFLIIYYFSIKNFEKSWEKTITFGLLLGLSLSLILLSWGGAVTFIITIFPASFLLIWIGSRKNSLKGLVFYYLFLISSILWPLLFWSRYETSLMLNMFKGSYGILIPFVGLFILIDYLISNKLKIKEKLNWPILNNKQYIYSLLITVLIGFILLKFTGRDIFPIFSEIWSRLIDPFNTGRLSLTVSENAQPYLNTWISQTNRGIFYTFLLGLCFVGIKFFSKIHDKKSKIILIVSWIFLISGVTYSRISSTSIFNGFSFISKLYYSISVIIFILTFLWFYNQREHELDWLNAILLATGFFTLLNGRSAVRVFFLIAPFVCFFSAYAISSLLGYSRRINDDIMKKVFFYIFLGLLLFGLHSGYQNYQFAKYQTANTGLSAGTQWQKAMSWVRDNTPEQSTFIHWWDYGYWIQTLGKRPTVTDGGHSGQDQTDHYIGRYVLTTPNPESAFSYMKTWNVSYLLIDPTDFGKYPAYSSIGGGNEDPNDRLAMIPLMQMDTRQTKEIANGTILVYSGGTNLFEDIIYEKDGKQIFLPAGKASIGGILIRSETKNNINTLTQPEAVYFYNGEQISIPIRYLYTQGKLTDFGSGLDAVVDLIPSFDGQSINQIGVAIYLSQKVSKSLFAQMYIMDDVFGNYPTISLAHQESDPIIESIRSQGYNYGEFMYYQGFRGPIKIWEVNYPDNIKIIPEFFELLNGEYARFDNWSFVE